VLFVFAGVGRAVRGNAVDRQERAVEDHECLRRRGPHSVGQAGGEGGQELDSLGDVSGRPS
jgi:hypothetical protein